MATQEIIAKARSEALYLSPFQINLVMPELERKLLRVPKANKVANKLASRSEAVRFYLSTNFFAKSVAMDMSMVRM